MYSVVLEHRLCLNKDTSIAFIRCMAATNCLIISWFLPVLPLPAFDLFFAVDSMEIVAIAYF